MENCSFILFLWLVMQGELKLIINVLTIKDHNSFFCLKRNITIYEYFAPLSDDSLWILHVRMNYLCFIQIKKKVVYSSSYTIIEILKRSRLNELYSEMNYVPAKAVPELNMRF
ncbi:hypothetical protein T01_16079 [Trichinella spiralis]|uniref:SCAN domain-containing protein 3 n=1 Tax=Trichinella spiralis TaxID=6334 RepID=A0A0V1BQF0_TRISP|nr:hypothetical protein T01_16079 [Trichinella spiralis]